MSLALVLAGGRLVVTPRLRELVAGAGLIVAADGGAVHATAIGRRPDLWVGDFDSTPPELEATFTGVSREFHPRDKAQVDTELALEAALARGAASALVLGAFGGRFDHALAVALASARFTLAGFPVGLDSGDEAAYPLVPGQSLALALERGQTFSVLALSEVARGLTVRGARWPLHRADLAFGLGWGVSNEASGPVEVGPVELELEGGLALVVVQHGPV